MNIMEKIVIDTPSSHSEISCGVGAFSSFCADTDGADCFLVTDDNVLSLYSAEIRENFPRAHVFAIKAGEKSKNYGVLHSILKGMIEAGMTRKSCVLALGGGVVGDIAGLAASLYMRGADLVQIPTTLLAQVDSSVGGKTAVDMCGVKNVVGSFYQPRRVIVDPLFLNTLPVREIRCGLGEIIKYGALDGGIFDALASNLPHIKDRGFLGEITPACIRHKAEVVMKDERDRGERRSLNLGHTTGHAFELRYKRRSHGEFVLIGMYYELYIAQKLGVCGGEYADMLRKLIKAALPSIPKMIDVSAAKYDKKNSDRAEISVIAPSNKGEWREIKLDYDKYCALIEECAQKTGG